jgi:hypothetical protein
LQAEIANDSLDAADADEAAGLLNLLSDDFGGSIGIQKAMANDLTNEFFGAAVIGMWTAWFAFKRSSAVGFELVEQLEIALLGIAVFESGLCGAKPFALAFDEHGEFAGDFVVLLDRDGTGRADEKVRGTDEFEHEEEFGRERQLSQIRYGGKMAIS